MSELDGKGYDAWKTDAPDPGSGNGKPEVVRYFCKDCDWHVRAVGLRAATVALQQLRQHEESLGHEWDRSRT